MAKGDKKRTYKFTEESVDIIDWMERNTILDKSDAADRMVKYYWKQYQDGELEDPLLADAIEQASDTPELSEETDNDSSLMDRLRGKKE
jgi:hypothetical protein